jgi:hypothetical protein
MLIGWRRLREGKKQIYAVDQIAASRRRWVDECETVASAYLRWSRARGRERASAFEAYRAALDLEEQASRVYAAHARRAPRELSSQPPHSTALPVSRPRQARAGSAQ